MRKNFHFQRIKIYAVNLHRASLNMTSKEANDTNTPKRYINGVPGEKWKAIDYYFLPLANLLRLYTIHGYAEPYEKQIEFVRKKYCLNNISELQAMLTDLKTTTTYINFMGKHGLFDLDGQDIPKPIKGVCQFSKAHHQFRKLTAQKKRLEEQHKPLVYA